MTHIICSPELQPLYNSEISMDIGKRYYTSHGKSMHATFLLRLNSWTRLNGLIACLIFVNIRLIFVNIRLNQQNGKIYDTKTMNYVLDNPILIARRGPLRQSS